MPMLYTICYLYDAILKASASPFFLLSVKLFMQYIFIFFFSLLHSCVVITHTSLMVSISQKLAVIVLLFSLLASREVRPIYGFSFQLHTNDSLTGASVSNL